MTCHPPLTGARELRSVELNSVGVRDSACASNRESSVTPAPLMQYSSVQMNAVGMIVAAPVCSIFKIQTGANVKTRQALCSASASEEHPDQASLASVRASDEACIASACISDEASIASFILSS
jgi:hypothetical protein